MSTQGAEEFYQAFESRFRGSRELIKSRLRIYLPIVEPLKQFDSRPAALDLGCGRGEWLEVLAEAGFDSQGVDLDEGMLRSARDRNLNVMHADAIEFLRNAGSETQFVISGFHLAEHLEFHNLQTLVRESLRVLRPGGFLILETPNPENIRVGTSSFYLDPTHQRPIPPGLLSFLPDYFGFKRIKILRLQEDPSLLRAPTATLLDVLTQVSPDYAVVAQKSAENTIMDATGEALEIERGVTLEHLANKFDEAHGATVASLIESASTLRGDFENQLKKKDEFLVSQQVEISRLTAQILENHAQLNSARDKVERLLQEQDVRQRATNDQIEKILQENDRQQCAARERIEQLLQENESYCKSRSWRLTAPLRAIHSLFGKNS